MSVLIVLIPEDDLDLYIIRNQLSSTWQAAFKHLPQNFRREDNGSKIPHSSVGGKSSSLKSLSKN